MGDRTLTVEALVLPSPLLHREAVFRQALARDAGIGRARFALDAEGGLVLRARMPVGKVTGEELELLLAEVYDLGEVASPAFVALAYDRETNP